MYVNIYIYIYRYRYRYRYRYSGIGGWAPRQRQPGKWCSNRYKCLYRMGGHRGTAGWDMAGDCQLLQLMYLMYFIIKYSVIPGI